MKKDDELEKILESLTRRAKLIEACYNPDGLNLHFDNLKYADSALFEALLSIGQDAWEVFQNNHTRDNIYWFYDYFQLVSRGSGRILTDNDQAFISEDVIVRLALLISEIAQLTGKRENQGDITKRNFEALVNLFLAFSYVRKIAITRAKGMNNQDVIKYINNTIKYVKEFEKRMML